MEFKELFKDALALRLTIENCRFQENLEIITDFRCSNRNNIHTFAKELFDDAKDEGFSKGMTEKRICKITKILVDSLVKVNRKMDIYKQLKDELKLREKELLNIPILTKRMNAISRRLVKIHQML